MMTSDLMLDMATGNASIEDVHIQEACQKINVSSGIFEMGKKNETTDFTPWMAKEENIAQLADTLGVKVEMCHYPPGTSKYNPIERRLWSQVSHAWTAKPLKSLEIVKGYTRQTGTQTGLTIDCEVSFKTYLTESEKKKGQSFFSWD